MIYSHDGHLYLNGNDFNSGEFHAVLYSYENGTFSQVAEMPHGGYEIAEDFNGYLYTATSYGDDQFSEIWRVNVATGNAELLASGLGSPSGIVFDPNNSTLYVSDQLDPFHITAITVPVPESSTLVLLTLGAFGILLTRRKFGR
jgi:glucose/arabinose dehydrogenase